MRFSRVRCAALPKLLLFFRVLCFTSPSVAVEVSELRLPEIFAAAEHLLALVVAVLHCVVVHVRRLFVLRHDRAILLHRDGDPPTTSCKPMRLTSASNVSSVAKAAF